MPAPCSGSAARARRIEQARSAAHVAGLGAASSQQASGPATAACWLPPNPLLPAPLRHLQGDAYLPHSGIRQGHRHGAHEKCTSRMILPLVRLQAVSSYSAQHPSFGVRSGAWPLSAASSRSLFPANCKGKLHMKIFESALLLVAGTAMLTFSAISLGLFPRPLTLGNPCLLVEALAVAAVVFLVLGARGLYRAQRALSGSGSLAASRGAMS